MTIMNFVQVESDKAIHMESDNNKFIIAYLYRT